MRIIVMYEADNILCSNKISWKNNLKNKISWKNNLKNKIVQQTHVRYGDNGNSYSRFNYFSSRHNDRNKIMDYVQKIIFWLKCIFVK